MKKKIVIDCDVGVDDALALILAFHSPELEVMGVTGVNGNVSLDKVMKNIEKVLSLLQPLHRPFIARGAALPLKGGMVHAESVHGEDGLGGVPNSPKEGEEWWQFNPHPAEELFIEMARQYPDEITLVAIGPLTNLALGLQRDPEGMKKFKELVIMGGAVRTGGNITPYAEFNFFVDPLAAKIVLDSGLPITLVPLDVTHRVALTPQIMQGKFKPRNNPFSEFVMGATGFDPILGQFRGRAKVFYLHDPLAVGAVIEPGLVTKERLPLTVETKEGEHYGQVWQVPVEKAWGNQRVDACLGVDGEKFLELFLQRLKG